MAAFVIPKCSQTKIGILSPCIQGVYRQVNLLVTFEGGPAAEGQAGKGRRRD